MPDLTERPESASEPVVPERASTAGAAGALSHDPGRGTLLGRAADLARAVQELDLARAGELRVLAVEGEAGIGKTRFLGAIAETAAERGLVPLYAAADEEIRAPFLVARTIVTAPELAGAQQPPHAREVLARARGCWSSCPRGATRTTASPTTRCATS